MAELNDGPDAFALLVENLGQQIPGSFIANGDLDLDGDADLDDVEIAARLVLAGLFAAKADMNVDGKLDQADLVILEDQVATGS